MLTVSTFGVPMSGNKGSASMLQSILDNFPKEFGETKFNIFTYYPKADRKLNKTKDVNVFSGTPFSLLFYLIPVSVIVFLLNKIKIRLPNYLFGREVRALIESDLVLDVGGTTFKDEKLVKILFNVAYLLPGLLLKKKVIKYSQTMGPFKHPFNRTAARLILPNLELIVARGRHSENNLKELGLRNCTCCADGSFSMDLSDAQMNLFMKAEFEKITKAKHNKLVVGISPNSIVDIYCRQNNINHAEIFGKFIDYLINKDYFVILIPHSYRPDTKLRHNNDAITIEEIRNYISSKESFYVVQEDYDCKQLRLLIGLTDYYVASRFHSMISALSTLVPVIVIGWGKQKYLEVMEEFELEDYCFGFDLLNAGANELIKQFEKMVQNTNSIRESINRNLPRVVESSRKYIYHIKKLMTGLC